MNSGLDLDLNLGPELELDNNASTIVPIDASCLSIIMPIDYCVYQALLLSTIMPFELC